jgi:uncharacterized membrane protein YwaF
MKLHLALFVIFAALATLLGPFIASTSGASSIEILSAVVTFGSLLLMLIFGILAVRKSDKSKGLKAALIILVVIATFAAFIAAALQM